MCGCVCLGVLCLFNVFLCVVCKRTEWCFMVWLLFCCLCVSGCCLMCVMCVVYVVMSCRVCLLLCCCVLFGCFFLCVRVRVCLKVFAWSLVSCDVAMCCRFCEWLLCNVCVWYVCGFACVVVWRVWCCDVACIVCGVCACGLNIMCLSVVVVMYCVLVHGL